MFGSVPFTLGGPDNYIAPGYSPNNDPESAYYVQTGNSNGKDVLARKYKVQTGGKSNGRS